MVGEKIKRGSRERSGSKRMAAGGIQAGKRKRRGGGMFSTWIYGEYGCMDTTALFWRIGGVLLVGYPI